MKINVEENLYILSDDRQFILSLLKTRNVKDKDTGEERTEEYFDNVGYYSTLQQVCKSILTRKVKESTATDLMSLLTDLERIRMDIEEKIFV